MKYMLLLTRGAWQDTADEALHAKVFGEIGEWFGRLYAEGKIVSAHKLQDPDTATTVVLENGTSLLLDRPLIEAKEAVGGYAVVEVADLDEALALARSFPMPDGKVEVRPVDEM